jgi:hypothetical protein
VSSPSQHGLPTDIRQKQTDLNSSFHDVQFSALPIMTTIEPDQGYCIPKQPRLHRGRVNRAAILENAPSTGDNT